MKNVAADMPRLPGWRGSLLRFPHGIDRSRFLGRRRSVATYRVYRRHLLVAVALQTLAASVRETGPLHTHAKSVVEGLHGDQLPRFRSVAQQPGRDPRPV